MLNEANENDRKCNNSKRNDETGDNRSDYNNNNKNERDNDLSKIFRGSRMCDNKNISSRNLVY